MYDGRILQHGPPMAPPERAFGNVADKGGEDVNLERSPGLVTSQAF